MGGGVVRRRSSVVGRCRGRRVDLRVRVVQVDGERLQRPTAAAHSPEPASERTRPATRRATVTGEPGTRRATRERRRHGRMLCVAPIRMGWDRVAC